MDGADQLFKGPDNTALRFWYEPVKNNFQTEKHGRPIFDNALMVEVMVPGSNQSSPTFELERTYCPEAGTDAAGNRMVTRSPKYAEFEQQIAAFKAHSKEGIIDGTPLNQWGQVDAGTAATLKAAGIHTVEMLAGVQDGHLQNLGIGGRILRDQARAFISTRQFGVPSAQMAAESAKLHDENVRLTNELQALKAQLADLSAQLEAAKGGTADTPSLNTTFGAPPLTSPNMFSNATNTADTEPPPTGSPAVI